MDIIGSDNSEVLNGTAAGDLILGLGGNDIISGNEGDDTIAGGGGVDTIDGGTGNDIIYGDNGDGDPWVTGSDSIHGGIGNDTIYSGYYGGDFYGDDGNDQFIIWGGNAGYGLFHGGAGTDTIYITNFGESNAGHPDYLALNITSIDGVENIINGGSLPAYIYANDGGGTLDLRSVSNVVGIAGLRGSGGDDTIYGHVIQDTTTSTTVHGVQIEAFDGNDILFGTQLTDILYGGNGTDQLDGGAGADALHGDAGHDLLYGSAGNDQLYGGADDDWFWFDIGQGTDIIMDWQDGIDKIVLGASITTINLYNNAGSALLEFGDGSANHTYALLNGVSPASIDGGDFLFA